MGLWDMIVAVTLIGALSGVISKWVESRKAGGPELAGRLAALEADLDATKKRVRNLETIAAMEQDSREPLQLGEPDPNDPDSFDEKLVNQLAAKKRTR